MSGMTGPINDILDRVSFVVLHSISPSYIVNKIAFCFRILTILILLPPILIGLLDVTAYVIARTLAAPKDRERTPSVAVPVNIITIEPPQSPSEDSPSRPNSRLSSRHRATSLSSIHGRPPARGEPAWFTFPGADEKLSGEGIFSPPISRTPTPSNEMPSITSSLFMTPANADPQSGGRKTLTPPLGWENVSVEDGREHGLEGHASAISEGTATNATPAMNRDYFPANS